MQNFVHALIALGPLGVLALAFLDSSGIPVAAGIDALLILLAVQSPRVAWISAAFAVAGSVAGNLALFGAARRGKRRFLERSAPGKRTARLRAWFEQYGLVTIFVPALVPFPMPLKIFVIFAGVFGTRRTRFVSVILLARVLRYGAAIWLGFALGRSSTSFLLVHAWHFAVAGVLLCAALFLLVHFRNSNRRVSGLKPRVSLGGVEQRNTQ